MLLKDNMNRLVVNVACVAGAKRGGERGEGGGRKGNPPLLFPFLPIPYPLSPTPFDACYAGYGKCVLKTSALITTLKKLPAQVSLENNRKTFRRLMELFATFLKMQTLKY